MVRVSPGCAPGPSPVTVCAVAEQRKKALVSSVVSCSTTAMPPRTPITATGVDSSTVPRLLTCPPTNRRTPRVSRPTSSPVEVSGLYANRVDDQVAVRADSQVGPVHEQDLGHTPVVGLDALVHEHVQLWLQRAGRLTRWRTLCLRHNGPWSGRRSRARRPCARSDNTRTGTIRQIQRTGSTAAHHLSPFRRRTWSPRGSRCCRTRNSACRKTAIAGELQSDRIPSPKAAAANSPTAPVPGPCAVHPDRRWDRVGHGPGLRPLLKPRGPRYRCQVVRQIVASPAVQP